MYRKIVFYYGTKSDYSKGRKSNGVRNTSLLFCSIVNDKAYGVKWKFAPVRFERCC